jgi:hypothetical protein
MTRAMIVIKLQIETVFEEREQILYREDTL